MKKRIPLASAEAPLAHNPLVPAWRDEFDLRAYFACIHPRHYALKDSADLEPAQYLFGITQLMIIHYVALYRAALLEHHQYPSVFRAVAHCLRAQCSLELYPYGVWLSSANDRFAGKTPAGWFKDRGLLELAERVTFQHLASGDELLAEVPITIPGFENSTVLLDRQRTERARQGEDAAHRKALRLVRSLFPQGGWEDEFDPSVRLVIWSPWLKQLDPAEFGDDAIYVFNLMQSQFVGWISIYRGALEAGCQQAGAIRGVVACTQQMLLSGGLGYPDWFETPNATFAGLAPRQWLRLRHLRELEELLDFSKQAKSD